MMMMMMKMEWIVDVDNVDDSAYDDHHNKILTMTTDTMMMLSDLMNTHEDHK